ncbi:phosphoribosylanthranilate isomerase [Flavihumibacter profundi]|uniref:phosphoribosylanthranilate isomerase n=1 Tax=Flavihumibacter profundi TaxID=2716883 RepID=UPI001CC3BA3E|nr:phosphoribosylanthranilate isomerase [Flavihumibacter profundi]MBZ5856635.1 phosphoribosylanthranilate isomerase [Flavihumibacter profundi]
MRVKVCGMTQLEQVDRLEKLGATFAGFIFYPRSPRYVLRYMTTTQLKKENNINKVGVFVNAGADEVIQMVDECRLHMVQLHGDETPKYCEKIADYVSVVKAFRLSDNDNIEWMIKPYLDVCDMFLFDTMGVGYGGTGKKFDWNILKNTNIGKPYFLSGGIEPADEKALKEFASSEAGKGLFAIDINSQFESSPGVKDLGKVGKFISSLSGN